MSRHRCPVTILQKHQPYSVSSTSSIPPPPRGEMGGNRCYGRVGTTMCACERYLIHIQFIYYTIHITTIPHITPANIQPHINNTNMRNAANTIQTDQQAVVIDSGVEFRTGSGRSEPFMHRTENIYGWTDQPGGRARTRARARDRARARTQTSKSRMHPTSDPIYSAT